MQRFLTVLALATALAVPAAMPEPLRMNQIQVIGTHNSYHVRPEGLEMIKVFTPEAEAWDYTHPPLDVQLDRGVRNFELDLYHAETGFEVYHVPVVDAETTCLQLEECLRTIRDWSDANPHHVPITIHYEFKVREAALANPPTLPLDAAMFERLDAVTLEIMGDKLITPDEVRGEYATLREAITEGGWPLLDDVRGRVLILLHNPGELRDIYTANHPTLEGRPLFVRSEPDRPDAATLVRDNPRDPAIPDLVRQGFWVRTRVDSGLRQSQERYDAAFASGAHVLTTDFPPGSQDEETGYVVTFEDGAPARCNPVNFEGDCPASFE